MLSIENLTIGYRNGRSTHVVASDIDEELHEGELVCLLGPNGAGKSTLMRTVAGMQEPLGGRVSVDGEDIHEMAARDRARRLAVVLTERVDGGLLTSHALVGLGRYPHTNWSGRLSEHDHDVVSPCIARVGAEELEHRYVGDLSDGERQRVMMARALAQEPRMMILDEITAFLDLPRRVEIMRLLRRLARETRQAILISTHDLDLALRAADRVWLMPKGGELRTGAPEDLVLDGSFEAAFASEGVDFDSKRGAFQVHQTTEDVIEVEGQGLPLHWTARALEREGLGVWDGSGARPSVRIAISERPPVWELQRGDNVTRHASIHALAAALRSDRKGRPT